MAVRPALRASVFFACAERSVFVLARGDEVEAFLQAPDLAWRFRGSGSQIDDHLPKLLVCFRTGGLPSPHSPTGIEAEIDNLPTRVFSCGQ